MPGRSRTKDSGSFRVASLTELRDYIWPMVALKPVAQTARIVVEQRWLAVPVVNVFHWFKTTPVSPFTQAEIDGLASAVRAAFNSNFAPLQDGDLTVLGATAVDLSSETGVTGSSITTSAGTKAGVSNPSNVAMCLTWEIARHYRGGHPRSYMAGTVSADIQGVNQWVSTVITAWDTAAGGFLSTVNTAQPGGTATGRLVAVHRYRNKLVLDPPLVSTITGVRVGSRIDSQRRRLGKES